MKKLVILLVGCIFSEGNTLLCVSQALSNMGHSVKYWNVLVRNKPTDDDYDMAIVWVGRPISVEVFNGKPVAYVYLDDNEFWKKENPANTIENCTKGYKHIFTNMVWDGYDSQRYHWLPVGCLKDLHGKIELSENEKNYYSTDVVFMGTNRGKREQLILEFRRKMNPKYKFMVWGNGWEKVAKTKPMYFYDFTRVMSASKIVITEHWKNGLSTNDCEKPACNGALTITDSQIVKEQYPPIPYYNNIDEAVRICEYYLEHEEERLKLVKGLYLIAYQNFDYEKQLQKIIQITMGYPSQQT